MMASLTDIEYAAFTILVNGSGQGCAAVTNNRLHSSPPEKR